MTAPEMPCEPISFPFSRTAMEMPSSFFSASRLVVSADQLRELVRGGESGRPRADDDDVDVEGLALDSGKFGHFDSLLPRIAGCILRYGPEVRA